MTRRDNITRWRAKGLWMDVFELLGVAPHRTERVSNGNPSGIAYSWELQLRWRIRRRHEADVDGT